jgi:hypothetical protein
MSYPSKSLPLCIAVTLCAACASAQSDEAVSPAEFVKAFSVDSFVYEPTQRNYQLPPPQRPGLFKNFSLKSFGYPAAPFLQGYEPVPTTSTFYNQPDLECPACTMGPPNRTRFTIAPFGSEATLGFWHGRIQLFASFGGSEAWRPDGMLQGLGTQLLSPLAGIHALKPVAPNLSPLWTGSHLLYTDQYNDAWLVQFHYGTRYFLDRRKNISVGISEGYLFNFAPAGQPRWKSTTADLTITFGNGPAKYLARHLQSFGRKFRVR